MSKPVILTGLRANNDLHIGNYLGAMLPIIDMAKEKAGQYQINLFVPDLHSFTTPIDHNGLPAATMENIRTYAALGFPIDHDAVYVYRQSYISAHAELMWILSCFTGFGEMRRMTQFKEKSSSSNVVSEADSASSEAHVSVGLFNYPILMAADILLYGAEYVPVGDDQTQHLEFARDIAQRLNNKFGELFVIPHQVSKQHSFFGKDQGLRIRDLVDPMKKMSKSDKSGKGVLFLCDSPETARKKILSATTDSLQLVAYNYQVQPGVSNLLDILELFGGNKAEFLGQTQYGPLKQAVAEHVVGFIETFQTARDSIDDTVLQQKLQRSEQDMGEQASKTLLEVQRAVGLRPKTI